MRETEKLKTVSDQLKQLRPGRNTFLFIICILAALLISRLLEDPGFNQSQKYVLFLLFFSIGLWLTEAIPPFAVGLFIMAYLAFTLGDARLNTEPREIAKYLQTFSNSIIWLLLGGFFLAEVMTKTGIDVYFFRFCLKLSGKIPKNILLGIMLMTMVASMILSNSATTSMLIAAVMPLIRKMENNTFSKALIIGIPLAATVGGMGTIIGSPTNAIAAGALAGSGIAISFIKWMYFGVPLALVLTIAGWWMLKRKYIHSDNPIEIEFPTQDKPVSRKTKVQIKIVVAVLVVTIFLWLTSSLHHLTVSAVAAVPIVILTMTGIMKAEDVRKIPWDTLILVAGGLSLGLGLQDTGILEHFAAFIKTSTLAPWILYLAFAYITMIFSNIMSNTATATILIPMGIQMMPEHAAQIAVVVGLTASTALFLPVSTPPNAIAYSTGLIKQKEFFPGGLLIGLLGPALIVLFVMVML
jgi:solute carrier family 13 (sodium-dependent dicarboxylate transporter), member 2/3/5